MSETGVNAVIFDLGGVLIDWSPYHLYRQIFETDGEIAAFLELQPADVLDTASF